MPTVWNPADKSAQVTLSDSNHLMVVTTTGANAGVRATTQHASGKWYFELSDWVDGQFNNKVGFATLAHVLSSFSNTDSFGFQPDSGSLDGGSTPLGVMGPSAVLQVAIDIDAGFYWCRYSGGTWQGAGASADPATGVSGAPFTAWIAVSTGMYPWAQMFSNSGHISQIRINCGDRAFANAPPAGFTAWDSIPPFTQSFGAVIS